MLFLNGNVTNKKKTKRNFCVCKCLNMKILFTFMSKPSIPRGRSYACQQYQLFV